MENSLNEINVEKETVGTLPWTRKLYCCDKNNKNTKQMREREKEMRSKREREREREKKQQREREEKQQRERENGKVVTTMNILWQCCLCAVVAVRWWLESYKRVSLSHSLPLSLLLLPFLLVIQITWSNRDSFKGEKNSIQKFKGVTLKSLLLPNSKREW